MWDTRTKPAFLLTSLSGTRNKLKMPPGVQELSPTYKDCVVPLALGNILLINLTMHIFAESVIC